jgi:transcriptional regulator with XRE-family HTH domain
MSSRAKLSPLCLAVKRTREASKESQEVFAQNLAITVTSVSRFERGVTDPASFDLLNRLEAKARNHGLTQEAALFAEARSAVRFRAYQAPTEAQEPARLPQWRVAIAARVAAVYFPDRLSEIERALGPAVALVDTVLRSADKLDYRSLEREVFSLAEAKTFEEYKRTPATIDDREGD